MIFVRLYRKYFLNYDTKKMYTLHQNLNINKLYEVRYKGNYDKVLFREYLLDNEENICFFYTNKYQYDIIESPLSMPIILLNNSESLDKNLI